MNVLENPVVTTLIGLVVFYIGLKMFSGGLKSMGRIEWMESFTASPYWMFLGGIICTLAWQSSSLSTTAIVALVSSGVLPIQGAIGAVLGANIGTTGTIWLAGFMVSDGLPTGPTKQIAVMHTGVNLLMGLVLLPFATQIGRLLKYI